MGEIIGNIFCFMIVAAVLTGFSFLILGIVGSIIMTFWVAVWRYAYKKGSQEVPEPLAWICRKRGFDYDSKRGEWNTEDDDKIMLDMKYSYGNYGPYGTRHKATPEVIVVSTVVMVMCEIVLAIALLSIWFVTLPIAGVLLWAWYTRKLADEAEKAAEAAEESVPAE